MKISEGKHEFILAEEFMKSGYYYVIWARNRQEVEAEYPYLTIIDEFPEFISISSRDRTRELAYDIDGPRIPRLV